MDARNAVIRHSSILHPVYEAKPGLEKRSEASIGKAQIRSDQARPDHIVTTVHHTTSHPQSKKKQKRKRNNRQLLSSQLFSFSFHLPGVSHPTMYSTEKSLKASQSKGTDKMRTQLRERKIQLDTYIHENTFEKGRKKMGSRNM
jgi:hypothetical protein